MSKLTDEASAVSGMVLGILKKLDSKEYTP